MPGVYVFHSPHPARCRIPSLRVSQHRIRRSENFAILMRHTDTRPESRQSRKRYSCPHARCQLSQTVKDTSLVLRCRCTRPHNYDTCASVHTRFPLPRALRIAHCPRHCLWHQTGPPAAYTARTGTPPLIHASLFMYNQTIDIHVQTPYPTYIRTHRTLYLADHGYGLW